MAFRGKAIRERRALQTLDSSVFSDDFSEPMNQTFKSPSDHPSDTTSHSWLQDFADPPAEYRLVPFWSWNEEMEPEEIKRQVRIIKQGGWGGAFVHSRIGLTTPYLGDDWFKAVDATLEACEEENLLVWLYDEDKWPSGYSGGTVPLADERFRAKALVARPVGDPIPDDCTPLGEPQNGLQICQWIAPLGDPWFNGTAAVDRGSKDAMRKFIDDAYESYYERYSQHYGGLIQAEFTDEPCMMFRIACPEGSVPHSETAFERFQEMHGRDPRPELHKLFTDTADSQNFRLLWHRTINDLFETNFSRQLGEWCTDHDIDLTGHYMCEHGIFAQQNWGVKIMPNYRHQQIPGIDHLGRQIDERITAKQCHSVVSQFGKKRMLSELYGVAGGGLSFEDRKWIALQQICLGVNLLNPHLSLYTMSGCRKRDFPQNIFYQQPWWELNHLLDDGLARLCLAMSQGVCRASTLLLHPQESAQALWQTRTDRFDEDLTQPYTGQDWNSLTPEGEGKVREIEKQFFACINSLLGAQRSFHLGDECIMREHGSVTDSERGPVLQVEQMSYRLIVIPSMETMAPSTFDLLKQFHKKGGDILIYGEPPRKLDGEPSEELSSFVDSLPSATMVDFADQVESLAPAIVRFEKVHHGDHSLLWIHPRQIEDGSWLLLLVNLSRTESFAGDFHIHGDWNYSYQMDEKTGIVTQLPVERLDENTIFTSLDLAPCECRLIYMTAEPKEIESMAQGQQFDHIEGQVIATPLPAWTVERLDDNALTLDFAAWKEADTDWSAGPVPVLEIQTSLNSRKYDGKLSLRYAFNIQNLAAERKLHLVIEHPERCTIQLNGEVIEYQDLPYWRDIRWMPIDITGKVQQGENTITLDYAEFEHGDPTIVEPATARYGTEIESLYLIGDFSVAGRLTGTAPLQPSFQKWNVPPVEVDTLERHEISLTDPQPIMAGDMTRQGLPFYAGRIAMECELPALTQSTGSVLLELEKLIAPIVEVIIDGETAGHLFAHPFQLDLTEQLNDCKPHSLRIIIYSTLRNLLGPHHHEHGELIEVGPGHFESWEITKEADRKEALHRWASGEWHPSDWREDYCMIRFGDLGKIQLVQTERAFTP